MFSISYDDVYCIVLAGNKTNGCWPYKTIVRVRYKKSFNLLFVFSQLE